MRKQFYFISIAALACLLCACSPNEKVVGNGKTQTITREVSTFNSVHANGHYLVNIVVGTTQQVTITADSNILPYIKTSVNNKTLNIDLKSSTNISPSRIPEINVTMTTLKGIASEGAVSVFAKDVDSKELSINSTGASKLNISGKSEHLDIKTSGATRIDARHLITENTSIDTSGASRIDITVNQNLAVEGSGSSQVLYFGDPKEVSEHISGSGWLRKATTTTR